jgi:hypothetical protein
LDRPICKGKEREDLSNYYFELKERKGGKKMAYINPERGERILEGMLDGLEITLQRRDYVGIGPDLEARMNAISRLMSILAAEQAIKHLKKLEGERDSMVPFLPPTGRVQ